MRMSATVIGKYRSWQEQLAKWGDVPATTKTFFELCDLVERDRSSTAKVSRRPSTRSTSLATRIRGRDRHSSSPMSWRTSARIDETF